METFLARPDLSRAQVISRWAHLDTERIHLDLGRAPVRAFRVQLTSEQAHLDTERARVDTSSLQVRRLRAQVRAFRIHRRLL